MPNITNIYQLFAFLIVAGLQVYAGFFMKKMATSQSELRSQIEETRAEMFRMASLSDKHVIRSEGHVAGLAATFESALKVAYLQGKVDGGKGSVPFPFARIAKAAKILAEHATQVHPMGEYTPIADPMAHEPGGQAPPADKPAEAP